MKYTVCIGGEGLSILILISDFELEKAENLRKFLTASILARAVLRIAMLFLFAPFDTFIRE